MGTTAILTLQHSPHETHPFNPMSSFIVNVSWMRMGWRMAPRSSREPSSHWRWSRWSPTSHPQGLFIMANLKHVSSPNSSIPKVPQLDPLLQADPFNRLNRIFLRIFWHLSVPHSCLFFWLLRKHVASGAATAREMGKEPLLCFLGRLCPFLLMRHLRGSEWWSFEPEGDVRMDRWSTSQ